jgi:hypothetical protein
MSDYLVSLPLTDVKNYLNLSNTTEAVDTWLTREVRTQMQAIEKYLDRPIVVQQFREDMDGTGEYRMNLTYTPVLSVLTLNVDNFRYFRDNTEIDASQFLLLDDACLELEHDYFPYGTKNVRVSYIAGFAEIEVPFARQRFDIRETDSGNLLTAYLPAGRYENANDVVTSLQEALNAVGDDRIVGLDCGYDAF